MALTYEESAALATDTTFFGRVKVSVLTYATFILNEAPSVAGHAPRYRWAQAAMRDPDIWARQVQPSVVMDGTIQAAGGATATDAQVQSATETVVNKFM